MALSDGSYLYSTHDITRGSAILVRKSSHLFRLRFRLRRPHWPVFLDDFYLCELRKHLHDLVESIVLNLPEHEGNDLIPGNECVAPGMFRERREQPLHVADVFCKRFESRARDQAQQVFLPATPPHQGSQRTS